VESTAEISIEDLIAEEDMVVTVTRSGYIKRNPVTLYASQHRGGKGKTAMGTKSDDFVQHLFVASTHATFLFITNFGKVYQAKVYELPMAGRSSLGKAIVNLLNFDEGEKLATVLTVDEFSENRYVVMATKKGRVKKTELMAYSRRRAGGLIGVKLADGDELIAARITDGTQEIFLGSEGGKVIRFNEDDVRDVGRGSMGVRGMRLEEDVRLVGMEVLGDEDTLLTVTENGYGKRSDIEDYRTQTRGGKGVFSIKTSERNGKMMALSLVGDNDELMMVTNKGKLIRTDICGINVISRNTQGVKLINLAEKETLIGIARLPKEDRHPDDENTCFHPDGNDADTPDEPETDMNPEDLDMEDPIDGPGDDE
jgi:DNA gyrase subunit A